MGKITVMPDGVTIPLMEGESILFHIRRAGVHLAAGCSGTGDCGTCRVRVLAGESCLSPPSAPEMKFVDPVEWRLSCQALITDPTGHVVIELPGKAGFAIVGDGIRTSFLKHPVFSREIVNGVRYVMRLGSCIGPVDGRCIGVCLDAGTTTLVLRWYDLVDDSTAPLASVSLLNPQRRFGDNIIDRIAYASSFPGAQEELAGVFTDTLNRALNSGPVPVSEIYEIVAVGNTVMRDLLCGYPIELLGKSPYQSGQPGAFYHKAKRRAIGINPSGCLYAPPVLGHFVGADMLAVILAAGMHLDVNLTMAIDIGTNTEIAVGNREQILVTSCASGPAFEGSGVKCGTGAIDGAINQVRINPDGSVGYSMIGDCPPVGICGSGIVDALAGMIEQGIIDPAGRFMGGRDRFFISGEDCSPGLPVFLDGEDIDAIKLAKSAVSTGVAVLLRKWGIAASQLSVVYLAGAFGTSIDPCAAEKIGLIPSLPPGQVLRAGNAAIEGASMMLLSREKREEAEGILRIVKHVSLENEPDFEDLFIERLEFVQTSD